MNVSVIVAADENNGIGNENKLLCHLPADLKYFKQLTTGHYILMGRKTFDSIGKPLKDRISLIITKSNRLIDGCHIFNSIEAGVGYAKKNTEKQLFIIGGDSIFMQSLHIADTVFLTRIHHKFNADVFFPELPAAEWELVNKITHSVDEKNAYPFTFETYKRIEK
ncbi:MAG: dihydrofolate reductase [Bacteroidia bacterium]|nr:dihydrofolate reductase [Bacteroidia bacterium]